MRAFAVLLIGALGAAPAMALEEPEYEVVAEFEQFELRRYAPYIVAETTVQGSFESAGNQAFRVLADYLFGNNRSREKMEMTAPVNQVTGAAGGEKMRMTAPVLTDDGPTGSDTAQPYTLSFVIPSKYTMDTVPVPVDERVSLRRVGEQLVAAHRFSGSWKRDNYRKHEATLLEALEQRDIEPRSAPVFARYNSPFWPWFLRRNEILVEVDAAAAVLSSR